MLVAGLGWRGGSFPGHIATGNEEEKKNPLSTFPWLSSREKRGLSDAGSILKAARSLPVFKTINE